MERRHDLTEAEWAELSVLLPNLDKGFGRPRNNDRELLNGIIYITYSGAAWRDLPDSYGPWQTVYGRMRQWTALGVWNVVYGKLKAKQQEEDIEIDTIKSYIDSTTVKAHKAATGYEKKRMKVSRH